MMFGGTTLTYPMVLLFVIVLAGASFLGYEHVLTGQVIAGIYSGVISGAAVGHFATTGKNSS